ncbi:MAG: four helix bundle protein [Candidatus Peribacteraceae bacterium]|jgi:four helix bundle protein|nr:four helix bundle protein [Candidatus Peribacteraceae bacterium]HCI03615.1 four helix bundle protein [Candidatus Peribacteria bacterium]|tara:strand:- start:3440 stop:3886 length:447 start_codon:yes stop_codon:yes gene_type:complete
MEYKNYELDSRKLDTINGSSKNKIRNPKQIRNPKNKTYDLEDRTLKFTLDIRRYIKQIPRTMVVKDACEQLIRSSGSIGANYIEANENLGKKDFRMRIKISRKEAKESAYWLTVILDNCASNRKEGERLFMESKELVLIFGAILRNSQ